MYNVTRVVHFEGCSDALDRAEYTENLRIAAKESGAVAHFVAPTLPGVINGGDLIAHLSFPSAAIAGPRITDLDAALAASDGIRIDGVGYPAPAAQSRPGAARSVYRALLLRVDPEAPAEVIDRFERDLLEMPRYISSIVSWRLGRVDSSVGSTEWSHIWEQEFTDHGALMGQYLDHPVHWSIVDRWFDPECPEVVVRDRVCHTFCAIDDVVL